MKYVKIAGKDYPVLYSFNALQELCELKECSFAEIDEIFVIDKMMPNDVVMLAFIGLQEGARRAKKKFEMTLEDVDDLLMSDMRAIGDLLGTFQKQNSTPPVGNPEALQRGAKKQKANPKS